jgi:hypothetical protein
MLPICLLPENVNRTDGAGPSTDASHAAGKLLVLTLGITQILEQESLEVSVWGSSDQRNWGLKPVAFFPPKSYCGFYSVLLNLSARPDIRYLRVQWKMNRWRKPAGNLLFSFYVVAEESGARMQTAAAGMMESAVA